jgi:colicin import membrane protein
MKYSLILILLLCAGASAYAQEDPTIAAHRNRIKSERAQAEALFKTQEKSCYQKFAVNDCLDAAKKARRDRLNDLHRQEISLNDGERKRKATERVRANEEQAAAERRRDDAQRARSLTDAQERKAKATEKAATRAADASSAPAKAAQRREQMAKRKAEQEAARKRKSDEEAVNRERHQQQLDEAQARKQALEKRLAERKKPPAAPLPPPQ